jgi:hypothetical protein
VSCDICGNPNPNGGAFCAPCEARELERIRERAIEDQHFAELVEMGNQNDPHDHGDEQP